MIKFSLSKLVPSLVMLIGLISPAPAREAPPLAVDDPALLQAAKNACRLDQIRTSRLFGLESHLDGFKEENRRRYDAWLAEYNRFVGTHQDYILVRFAEQMHSRHRARYSDAECRILVPTYGLAWTASHIDVRPGDVQGILTPPCGKGIGPCIDRVLEDIPGKCNIFPMSDTYVKDCNKAE